MGLSLPFPFVEIPMGEQGTQIIAPVNIKLAKYGREAVLDSIGGNVQTGGDLTVGIPQADKRGHVPFTGREGFPPVPQPLIGGVLCQTCGQDIGDQIVFRTAFVRGQGGKRDLQAFTRIKAISSRTGRWAQAYQVQ